MKRNDFQTFIQIGLSLGGGLLLAAVWLLITNPLATVEAQGSDGHSIYYVAPDGNCGVGVEPCFSDVQLAVDAVDDAEDVIKVAATNFSPGTPVAVGSGPWGIVYEPVHDQIYVANSGDSSVTVLRAADGAVIDTLSGNFDQPYHLAANTVTGKVPTRATPSMRIRSQIRI